MRGGQDRLPTDTTPLYEDELEQGVHWRAAQLVARDAGRSVADVMPLYEAELQRLKKGARIKDFLSVLVSQRLKNVLRDQRQWQ